VDIASRALNLAMAEWMGDVNLANTEISLYRKVTAGQIQELAGRLLREENCSMLYYLKKKSKPMETLDRIAAPAFRQIEKIEIVQAKASKLDNGIPVYTVNAGPAGPCQSGIHFSEPL
jgi:hypothetical protein